MGANEKHAATYHGGTYVPRTETVRELYGQSGNELAFDRWLDKIRFDAYNEGAEATHISGDLFDVDEAQANNPYRAK